VLRAQRRGDGALPCRPVALLAELLMAARGSESIDRTMRHLLERCRACRRGRSALRRLSRDAHHPDYVIVLAEAREASALWRQLGALPYASQLAAVEADERYKRWGLCRLLQRLSGEAACQEPESAGRLPNLAVRIPPGFIERELGVDAALSFLDLAALYLREGAEQSTFHQLSADLLPVFFYPKVGRKAMAFLLWFQQACETGKLTAGIVASVGQAAEGQRQPSLAWWSAPQIPSKEGTGDAGAAALG